MKNPKCPRCGLPKLVSGRKADLAEAQARISHLENLLASYKRNAERMAICIIELQAENNEEEIPF